jgi:adenylosuccinate synthase
MLPRAGGPGEIEIATQSTTALLPECALAFAVPASLYRVSPSVRLASGFWLGYGESVMATTVLVGAQWGDEGKGKGIDVLDTLPQIKVCVGYKVGSRMYETVPNDIDVLEQCTPVYQEFEGWQTPTKLAQDFDQLPKRARVYLQKLAQLSGAKLSLVSVGARREETIFL